MKHVNIDIETRSSVDLIKCGIYKYAQSEDFTVLLIGFSVDHGPVTVLDMTTGVEPVGYSEFLEILTSGDYIKHAYNAAFEWYCLSMFTDVALDPAQWRDTMLQAQYCAFPGSLEAAGAAIGLPQEKQKLTIGKNLIKLFCTPHKHTKKDTRDWINPSDEPEKWKLFIEYNRQDVIAEQNIAKKLAKWPVPDEIQAQWIQNLLMNTRGVSIDTTLVDGALYIADRVTEPLLAEATEISGIANPNSTAQLKTWLKKEGLTIDTLRKEDISDLLERNDLEPHVRRMLEIKKELSKSSLAKYEAMLKVKCSDGKAHGLTAFYGASRTGRFAGRLIQLQNLPRTYLSGKALDTARLIVKSKDAYLLHALYGSESDTLSQLIRTALIPSAGHKFIDADFSSIEARVLAWLAGEQWSLNVFRTHGKIYEAQASQMFGVPIALIKKGNPEYVLRQKGKVAVLALGYQGSVGALISQGALKMGIPEEDLPGIVKLWRNTNKRTVEFWKKVENAAINTVQTGRQTAAGKLLFTREIDGNIDFLTILLPSGRKLFYNNLRVAGRNILYKGQNQTSKKWTTLETYGGKLVENIVQAIARDILVEKIIALEAAGYNIVFHIHDEVVIDALQEQKLSDVVKIMSEPVSWAPDLPLNADGWEGEYFTKD